MKYKIKEIKSPSQGDYMLPKLYYVPMIKLYWFLPWIAFNINSDEKMKLVPHKKYLMYSTYTDAEEVLNKYKETKLFGVTNIIVKKYYDETEKYFPVVIIKHHKYGIYKTDNGCYLDDDLLSYKSKEEANDAITVYLNKVKSETVISTFKIPYNKNNNNFK